MIRAHGLAKRLGGRWVLRDLNLEAAPGALVALLGPNGAGKTTLLRVLATLARPSLGAVEVAGVLLPGGAAAARARLGLVAHQPMLYADLSAEDNLAFAARLYGVEQPQARIAQLLDDVGLARLGRQPVRYFSRGMQQRLALARALLHQPQVLLLDEPYSSLDPEATVWLDGLLAQQAAAGRTIVMASHDLVRSAQLAQRIAVLAGGRIVEDIPKNEFSSDLAARYLAALGKADA